MEYIRDDWYNSGAPTREFNKKLKACQLWENMRLRVTCLGKNFKTSRQKSYLDATCCDEWKDYANFYAWFSLQKREEGYKEGWQLDKEVIKQGNKQYCPELCVFIPKEINNLLTERAASNPTGYIGVFKSGNKYSYRLRRTYEYHYGHGFETAKDAFDEYAKQKKFHILTVTENFKAVLSASVLEGILRWEVRNATTCV